MAYPDMNIVLEYRYAWGKDLFYPVSNDAQFIAKLIGRTALQKKHVKLCSQHERWRVELRQKDLNEFIGD